MCPRNIQKDVYQFKIFVKLQEKIEQNCINFLTMFHFNGDKNELMLLIVFQHAFVIVKWTVKVNMVVK